MHMQVFETPKGEKTSPQHPLHDKCPLPLLFLFPICLLVCPRCDTPPFSLPLLLRCLLLWFLPTPLLLRSLYRELARLMLLKLLLEELLLELL